MQVAHKPTVFMGVRAELNSSYRKQEEEGQTPELFYCNLSRLLRHKELAAMSEVTRSFHTIANPYFSVLVHCVGEKQPGVSGRSRRKGAVSWLCFVSASYQILTLQQQLPQQTPFQPDCLEMGSFRHRRAAEEAEEQLFLAAAKCVGSLHGPAWFPLPTSQTGSLRRENIWSVVNLSFVIRCILTNIKTAL